MVGLVFQQLGEDLLGVFDMPLKPYSRYVSPIIEESLKALVIIYLFL